MKHLRVCSAAYSPDENPSLLLSELPLLQLTSLHLGVHLGEFSLPGRPGRLSASEALLLGQLHSLHHLKIECAGLGNSFAPFASLRCLRSFHLIFSYPANLQDLHMVGLNSFLACLPHLMELELPRVAECPQSHSLRCLSLYECEMTDLPTRATLPSLLHLKIRCLCLDLREPGSRVAGALQGLSNVSLECSLFSLRNSEQCPCAGFLQTVLDSTIRLAQLQRLSCSGRYLCP